jgi:hypothetical protein
VRLVEVHLSFLIGERVSATLLERSTIAFHGHLGQQRCGQYGGHVRFSFVPECRWHICALNPRSKSIHNSRASLLQ